MCCKSANPKGSLMQLKYVDSSIAHFSLPCPKSKTLILIVIMLNEIISKKQYQC